jgi:RNA polymerase sigma-70 factor, ECF subfamily
MGKPRAHPGESREPRDDGDIDAALVVGDTRRALSLLMERYGDEVFRYAYAMTGALDLAEEVRQRVFVEAFRDLERFTGRASIRAWLFGIARHRSLDATKAHRRWNRRYKNDAPEEPDTGDGAIERGLDHGRLVRLLAICLGKLAPAARDAVVLRFQQELSYDEAAVVVGALPGTLQQRVTRALPVLRLCIEAALAEGAST